MNARRARPVPASVAHRATRRTPTDRRPAFHEPANDNLINRLSLAARLAIPVAIAVGVFAAWWLTLY